MEKENRVHGLTHSPRAAQAAMRRKKMTEQLTGRGSGRRCMRRRAPGMHEASARRRAGDGCCPAHRLASWARCCRSRTRLGRRDDQVPRRRHRLHQGPEAGAATTRSTLPPPPYKIERCPSYRFAANNDQPEFA
ncbi:hypothetical protein GUJ93_ZPchr0006g40931 [Zizania palustris]|uniref:Uncharacterized protein n=1 Tax=Zizania palustris TaxID=103762 RepID=A0A8J5W2Y0_ZIZPA|nr:hypothetical protein GUJ93_ZPchr0006g40931 [Zizania palustris]